MAVAGKNGKVVIGEASTKKVVGIKNWSLELSLDTLETLYPILYRMEDDGLVVSRWSEARGKEVSRKYYSITAEGSETLEQLRSLWNRFSEKVELIMKGVSV